MQIYCRKIRHLIIDTRSRPLDCIAIQQQSLLFGHHYGLLPGLRTFTFTVTILESLLPSLLFIGTSLCTFNLDIHLRIGEHDLEPVTVVELFWAMLYAQAPGLTSLYLGHGVETASDESNALEEFLYSQIALFQNLRKLCLEQFSHDELIGLVPRLPNLEELTFIPWIILKSTPLGTFRRPLLSLDYPDSSFRWGVVVRNPEVTSNQRNLRHLHLGLPMDIRGLDQGNLLSTVASVLDSLAEGVPSLISLEIRTWSRYPLKLEKLRKDICFPFLRQFKLEVAFPSQCSDLLLTDDNVQDLAQMLPAITAISITSREASTIPSLQSIQAFAQHCPDITSLVLNVDATSPPDGLPPSCSKFQHSVSITFPALSYITSTSVAPTAIFLLALCGVDTPLMLTTLTNDEVEEQLWNDVRDQFGLFHQLRIRDKHTG